MSELSPPRLHEGRGTRIWYPDGLDDLDAEFWTMLPEWGLEMRLKETGERVLGTGRGAARAIRLGDDGRWRGVLRKNRHGGLLGRLLGDRYLTTRKLADEIALSEELRARDLPTPRVLLGVAVLRRGCWRQWLVTEEVVGARTVFDARDDPAALASADVLLERIFDIGLWATDLHPGNLLWQPAAATGPRALDAPVEGRCWLIDLAGARLLDRPLTERERRVRRARFARYFQKHAGLVPERLRS